MAEPGALGDDRELTVAAAVRRRVMVELVGVAMHIEWDGRRCRPRHAAADDIGWRAASGLQMVQVHGEQRSPRLDRNECKLRSVGAMGLWLLMENAEYVRRVIGEEHEIIGSHGIIGPNGIIGPHGVYDVDEVCM